MGFRVRAIYFELLSFPSTVNIVKTLSSWELYRGIRRIAESIVEFRIDGLDYYLRQSHESYYAKDYGDKNT